MRPSIHVIITMCLLLPAISCGTATSTGAASMTMNTSATFPHPIYQATFDAIQSEFDQASLAEFAKVKESDVVATYWLTLGSWLLDNIGFPLGADHTEYFLAHGIRHPEDMAGLLIVVFHRYLNGEDLRIDNELNRWSRHANVR